MSRSPVHSSGILRSGQFIMSCVQYKDFEFYGECECLSSIDIVHVYVGIVNIALNLPSYIGYNPFLASRIAQISFRSTLFSIILNLMNVFSLESYYNDL